MLAGSGRRYTGSGPLLSLFPAVTIIFHLRLHLIFQQNGAAGKGAVGADELQVIAIRLGRRHKVPEWLGNAGINLQVKSGIVADEFPLHIQLFGQGVFGADQNGAPIIAAGVGQVGAGRLRIGSGLGIRSGVRGWFRSRIGRRFGVRIRIGCLIVLLFIGRTGLLTGIGIRGGVGLCGIMAHQRGNAPNDTQYQ